MTEEAAQKSGGPVDYPIPAIFLPGLLCDRTVWSDQIAALADLAVCSVPDFGALDSLPRMAASVLDCAPDEFVLAGHSMGGRIALEMLRLSPERIRALALLDTGYQSCSPGDSGQREIARRMELIELARSGGMRKMGANWVHPMVHPARLADAPLIEAILDMIERKSLGIFEAQVRALLARPDAASLLVQIRCPTLVLCGREDSWNSYASHEEMARLIPGSKLTVINDCGHMSTMERPEQVSAALRAWLVALAH